MKTYKNINAFKKRVQKSTDWDDYFLLGGRIFNIYEYGGGWNTDEPCYVYFKNTHKGKNQMIKIEYKLPNINYINGEKVVKGQYQFVDLEYYPDYQYLWR